MSERRTRRMTVPSQKYVMAEDEDNCGDGWIGPMLKAIQSHPILWDPQNGQYSNRKARKRCWEVVSNDVMTKTGEEKTSEMLSKRWRAIREDRQKWKDFGNESARASKYAKYSTMLAFLDKKGENEIKVNIKMENSTADPWSIGETTQSPLERALAAVLPSKEVSAKYIYTRCQKLAIEFDNLETVKREYDEKIQEKEKQQSKAITKNKRRNLAAQKSRINKGKLQQATLRQEKILWELQYWQLRKQRNVNGTTGEKSYEELKAENEKLEFDSIQMQRQLETLQGQVALKAKKLGDLGELKEQLAEVENEKIDFWQIQQQQQQQQNEVELWQTQQQQQQQQQHQHEFGAIDPASAGGIEMEPLATLHERRDVFGGMMVWPEQVRGDAWLGEEGGHQDPPFVP